MKNLLRIAAAAALSISLAGCITDSNGNGFNIPLVTQPVTNVTPANLYSAELVFDASVKTFNTLKDLCAQRVLKPSCRTYVLKGQPLIRKAYAADVAARRFVDNNPKLDATNVIQAFTRLVSDFNGTVKSLDGTK